MKCRARSDKCPGIKRADVACDPGMSRRERRKARWRRERKPGRCITGAWAAEGIAKRRATCRRGEVKKGRACAPSCRLPAPGNTDNSLTQGKRNPRQGAINLRASRQRNPPQPPATSPPRRRNPPPAKRPPWRRKIYRMPKPGSWPPNAGKPLSGLSWRSSPPERGLSKA